MQKETIVRSYVRNKQQHIEPQKSNKVGWYLTLAYLIALVVYHFPGLTLVSLAFVGAAYGLKTLYSTLRTAEVVEAAVQPPEKPKRPYRRHIVPVVNHYQLGRVRI